MSGYSLGTILKMLDSITVQCLSGVFFQFKGNWNMNSMVKCPESGAKIPRNWEVDFDGVMMVRGPFKH